MGYFDKFNRGGIPFMDGAEKRDLKDVFGEKLHIADFGFIQGDNGEYAVMLFEEYPAEFYFGNQVITDMLKEVQKDGMEEALSEQAIVFEMATSKKGRDYIRYNFV